MLTLRVVMAFLWIENTRWKIPPDFGADTRGDLYGYVQDAITHPVFRPFSWLAEHLLLSNLTVFGCLAISGIAAGRVLGLVSPVFLVVPAGDAYRWVDMSAASSALLVISGLLGLAASTGRRTLALAAAELWVAGALVRLVGLVSHRAGVIGGSGATMVFLAALGLGFLVLGVIRRLPGDRE